METRRRPESRPHHVGEARDGDGVDGGQLQHRLPPVGALRLQHPRPQLQLPRLQLAQRAAKTMDMSGRGEPYLMAKESLSDFLEPNALPSPLRWRY